MIITCKLYRQKYKEVDQTRKSNHSGQQKTTERPGHQCNTIHNPVQQKINPHDSGNKALQAENYAVVKTYMHGRVHDQMTITRMLREQDGLGVSLSSIHQNARCHHCMFLA